MKHLIVAKPEVAPELNNRRHIAKNFAMWNFIRGADGFGL